jgi:RNA polymerase sigma factor (sigma-70 family)
MDGSTGAAILRDVGRLFQSGTVAGLSDDQLLRRFAERGDGPALEALLERHGPMVLAVCRQLLRDPHDAADAFQATLLVLVRKAPSLRVGDSLGPWLYGVASRVASRSRASASRRSARERTGLEPSLAVPARGRDLDDSGPVLHEELSRLPERLRAPIVHCHLEGLTHAQAAERLRCPVGTVRSRLARGRALLRERLERRGLDGPALLAAHWPVTGPARVPVPLAESTLRAAACAAAGKATAGAVSASVAGLTEGVLMSLLTTKLKAAASAVFASGLLATGAAVYAYQTQAPPAGVVPARTQASAGARPRPEEDPKRLSIKEKLKEPVTLDFEKQPLGEAITLLQKYTGLNIVLDPRALSDANISSAVPVSLAAKNIHLETALKLLLKPLRLTYKLEDEVVLITSSEALEAERMVVRTYGVGDLIQPSGRAIPASGPGAKPGGNEGPASGVVPKADMSPLIELITSGVAPGAWRVSDPSGADVSSAYVKGGEDPSVDPNRPIGTITPFFLSSSLIVRHTPEVHERVAGFLRSLRRLSELQRPERPEGEEAEARSYLSDAPPAPPATAVPAPPAAAVSRAERIRQLLAELNREVEAMAREQGRAKPHGP